MTELLDIFVDLVHLVSYKHLNVGYMVGLEICKLLDRLSYEVTEIVE